MTSSRPYLLRALYEWIVDNDHIPYIVLDARMPGVVVPPEHVKDGQITLNIAPHAVQGLSLGNAEVRFSARFGGRAFTVSAPVQAVLAIYDRETGQGMGFPPETIPGEMGGESMGEHPVADLPGPEETPPTPPRRGGHLRRVK
ncbi:MAG: ClpXP protease specificity-enhancing factor [Halothiobacillaceae bacterium]